MDLKLFRRFTDFSCIECKTIMVHECRCIPANSCRHGYLRIECKVCFADAKRADLARCVWGLAVGIPHSDECPGAYTGAPECTCDLGKIVKLCDAEVKP